MTKTSGTKSGCDHEVVIVGAGFSGLGAGIKLREAGIHDFVILDAADGVGGVWRHNTYPGVAVDIPSATYCYSFEPNPHWSRAFAPGKELRAYAEHCADEYGLRPHLRLRTFVEKAVFDEPHDRWRVHTSEGVITARFLVGAGRVADDNTPDCEIVDCGHLRRVDLKVLTPREELGAVCSGPQWGDVHDQVADHRPVRRCLRARDQIFDLFVHGRGDAPQQHDGDVAFAAFELRDVALRNPRCLGQHLPRHAAHRPHGADTLPKLFKKLAFRFCLQGHAILTREPET